MKIAFTRHALQRMALRLISPEEVKDVLKYGKVIKEYSDDKPNPSRLILSTVNERPFMF